MARKPFRSLLLLQLLVASASSASGDLKRKPKYTYDPKEYLLKPDFTMKDVRREFKAEFQGLAEKVTCAACRFTAGRLNGEIGKRASRINSTDPSDSLEAVQESVNATCGGIPVPLVLVPVKQTFEFMALSDIYVQRDPRMAKNAAKNAVKARVMAERMCVAVLTENQEEILRDIWSSWMPRSSWERFLCAKRHKLCKWASLPADDAEEPPDGTKTLRTTPSANDEALMKDILHDLKQGDASLLLKTIANIDGSGVEAEDDGDDWDPDLDEAIHRVEL